MAAYYFTVAELPSLSYEADPPITVQTFLEMCESTVTGKDFLALRSAGLVPATEGPSLLCSWYSWESSLRNELAKLRAAKLGRDADRYLKEAEDRPKLADLAREAAGQDDPLRGEEVLDKARWSYLDELALMHYFDLDTLLVYYLRLLILDRKAARGGGAEAYNELYASMAKQLDPKESGEST